MIVDKLTEKIWYYKELDLSSDDMIRDINKLSDDGKYSWFSYTNGYNPDGSEAESTVKGEAICIYPEAPEYEKILSAFKECLSDYLQSNNDQISLDNLDINNVLGRWDQKNIKVMVRRYFTGSKMSAHEDAILNIHGGGYTALLYLNDDYEGGELLFTKENISVKPEKYSLLIFPQAVEHEVCLVKNGTRYMTTGYLFRKYPSSEIAHL